MKGHEHRDLSWPPRQERHWPSRWRPDGPQRPYREGTRREALGVGTVGPRRAGKPSGSWKRTEGETATPVDEKRSLASQQRSHPLKCDHLTSEIALLRAVLTGLDALLSFGCVPSTHQVLTVPRSPDHHLPHSWRRLAIHETDSSRARVKRRAGAGSPGLGRDGHRPRAT